MKRLQRQNRILRNMLRAMGVEFNTFATTTGALSIGVQSGPSKLRTMLREKADGSWTVRNPRPGYSRSERFHFENAA